MKKIAITTGDPAGIGPEVVIKALKKNKFQHTIIVYGAFSEKVTIPELRKIKSIDEIDSTVKSLYWIPISKENSFVPAKPSKESGIAAYESLQRSCTDALAGKINALVTAPVSKHFIQLSHPDFIGHTEFFAQRSSTKDVVMSFFSDKITVGLLTTHCGLSQVSSFLTEEMILTKVEIINNALERYFKISKPTLALLGLNPHAGEEGAFGHEEQQVMIPAVDELKKKGIDINGPYPADTFFARNYEKFDMIISAYHDQALIPFKMLSFDVGVNVTLGLPFIRTSVDHGTAFDIAGKGIASDNSLKHAVKLAMRMIS